MMTRQQISLLIQRFVDGETSEHEEQQLAQYFAAAEQIPDEWREYKLMFDSFQTDYFDFTSSELDAFCQDYEDESASDPNLPIISRPSRHSGFRHIGIAASVAALIGIGVGSLYLQKQAEFPTLAISNQQAAKVITNNKPTLIQTENTSIDADRKQSKNIDENTMQARCLQKKFHSQTMHIKEDGDKNDTMPQPTSIASEAEKPTTHYEATYGMPNFDNAVRYIATVEIAQDYAHGDDDDPYTESEKQNSTYRNQHSETASIASSDEIQFSIVCNVRQEPLASAVDAEYGNND